MESFFLLPLYNWSLWEPFDTHFPNIESLLYSTYRARFSFPSNEMLLTIILTGHEDLLNFV